MTVKAILSKKGRNVVTTEPATKLAQVVKTLADHRIGAVIIAGPDRRVAGILSERDIVRALAERGTSVLEESADKLMTRRVITCSEADTVGEIMGRVTEGKFRHLPVVESGSLVGVISIGDVVKYRLEEMERESSALREYILTA